MHVQYTLEEDGVTLLAPCVKDKRGREASITDCVRRDNLDGRRFQSKYFKSLPQLGKLVRQMLEYEPDERPSIKRIESEVEEILSSYNTRNNSGIRRRRSDDESEYTREERKKEIEKHAETRGRVKENKQVRAQLTDTRSNIPIIIV